MADAPVGDADDEPPRLEPTRLLADSSRSVLAENDSPDLGFRFSLNPYRGCEHGCAYCYARPSHQHLGFSAGLDFETKILVKHDAPALLRKALSARRWVPQTIALSGNTDCYQPSERHLGLTRACLEVLAEFRNPVSIVTKGALVVRDLDLLAELARHDAVHVHVSINSLDATLARRLEPRAARPVARLEMISRLAAAGIPTAVLVAPVIPGLNDLEIPRILEAAAAAGAQAASWVMLRLASPLDEIFAGWLETHYPLRKERVLSRIRAVRAGRLNDSSFGVRQRGTGEHAEQIAGLFSTFARRHGIMGPLPVLNAAAFRRPPAVGEQIPLL